MAEYYASTDAIDKLEIYQLDSGFIAKAPSQNFACSDVEDLVNVLTSWAEGERITTGEVEESDAEVDSEEMAEEEPESADEAPQAEEEIDEAPIAEEPLEHDADDQLLEEMEPPELEAPELPAPKKTRMSWSNEIIARMIQLYIDLGVGRVGLVPYLEDDMPGVDADKIGAMLSALFTEQREMPSGIDDYIERFMEEYKTRKSKERDVDV
jgi:hypothetical protein